jgi:hypothetical protein
MICLQVAAGQQHTLFLMDEKSDVSKLSVWEPAPDEAPATGTKRKVLLMEDQNASAGLLR